MPASNRPRHLSLPNVHPVADAERANGGSADAPPPPDGRGKRIANRAPWLDLPDPFDNLNIRAWLDYPQEVAILWAPVDGESKDAATTRVMEACKSVFLAHDGWEDEEGVLPQPDTDEFWRRISTPLGAAIVQRFFGEITDSPNSRASRKRRRPT